MGSGRRLVAFVTLVDWIISSKISYVRDYTQVFSRIFLSSEANEGHLLYRQDHWSPLALDDTLVCLGQGYSAQRPSTLQPKPAAWDLASNYKEPAIPSPCPAWQAPRPSWVSRLDEWLRGWEMGRMMCIDPQRDQLLGSKEPWSLGWLCNPRHNAACYL